MPCVVAMDLVVSHEYIFKFSREDRVFLRKFLYTNEKVFSFCLGFVFVWLVCI